MLISDPNLIRKYCIAKYGTRVCNITGRSEMEQIDFDEQYKKVHPDSFYFSLPLGDYKPNWEHFYHKHLEEGVESKKLYSIITQRRINIINNV